MDIRNLLDNISLLSKVKKPCNHPVFDIYTCSNIELSYFSSILN